MGETGARVTTPRAEMLSIILAGHEHVDRLNHETGFLLSGLRRNGFLRWRPCPLERRLRRMEESEPLLCEKVPEKSHRIPDSWWQMRDSEKYNGEGVLGDPL